MNCVKQCYPTIETKLNASKPTKKKRNEKGCEGFHKFIALWKDYFEGNTI